MKIVTDSVKWDSSKLESTNTTTISKRSSNIQSLLELAWKFVCSKIVGSNLHQPWKFWLLNNINDVNEPLHAWKIDHLKNGSTKNCLKICGSNSLEPWMVRYINTCTASILFKENNFKLLQSENNKSFSVNVKWWKWFTTNYTVSSNSIANLTLPKMGISIFIYQINIKSLRMASKSNTKPLTLTSSIVLYLGRKKKVNIKERIAISFSSFFAYFAKPLFMSNSPFYCSAQCRLIGIESQLYSTLYHIIWLSSNIFEARKVVQFETRN